MAIPARVSIVTLGVTDLDRSTEFYKALGWELYASSNARISFFRTAGGVLALFPFDELAKDASLTGTRGSGFGGITLAINVERPEDVAPALQAAERAGAKVLKPAMRADWGGISGYFADPDGYPWEVAWGPGGSFTADGAYKMD